MGSKDPWLSNRSNSIGLNAVSLSLSLRLSLRRNGLQRHTYEFSGSKPDLRPLRVQNFKGPKPFRGMMLRSPPSLFLYGCDF